jgi:ATP:cob(I)alamin adenosyltransferase
VATTTPRRSSSKRLCTARSKTAVSSITTGHGDGGETGLLYGGRVAKDDLHTEAYGSLDEAISALGLARSLTDSPERAARILELQRELFVVGAELATGPGHRADLERHFNVVTAAMADALESEIHDLEARVPLPGGFVIPGRAPHRLAATRRWRREPRGAPLPESVLGPALHARPRGRAGRHRRLGRTAPPRG